jgi:hypothetical protein
LVHGTGDEASSPLHGAASASLPTQQRTVRTGLFILGRVSLIAATQYLSIY